MTNVTESQELTVANHPSDDTLGTRRIPFTPELLIDRDDFREEANKKYKRLVTGKRVRLRGAYVIEADGCDKDAEGNVNVVYARVIEGTLGEDPADGIKPKGVIHWVSASEGCLATVRIYDRLFTDANPGRLDDVLSAVNPASLEVIADAVVEPAVAQAAVEQVYQFEREGYFVADRYDHSPTEPVFNMTIGLRDTWGDGNG